MNNKCFYGSYYLGNSEAFRNSLCQERDEDQMYISYYKSQFHIYQGIFMGEEKFEQVINIAFLNFLYNVPALKFKRTSEIVYDSLSNMKII